MRFRDSNLALLKRRHPLLMPVYEQADTGEVEILESKSGMPLFKYRGISFHGIYKPEDEGGRFLAAISGGTSSVWVFGLGYGYHLKELIKSGARVTVYEPSPAILKSAIDHADLGEVLEKCRIVTGRDMRALLRREKLANTALVPMNPYLRFFEKQWRSIGTAFNTRKFIQEKKPRVMVVGPIYGGTETTFRHVREALENLGAETVGFDATAFKASYFLMDQVTPNEVHRNQLKQLYSNMLGESIVAMADDKAPDLILVMAQAPLDVATLARLRQLNKPIAFWFVEDFRTLKYWDRVAPYYDYFFTIQRGEFFDKLEKAGARRAAYLPQAASPASHHPIALTPEEKAVYGSDVSFMGAGYNNRKMFFNGLLDYDFKIWGTEWDLTTAVGKSVQNANRRLTPDEYIKIFCASKININLHSSIMLSGIDPVGDFVNPRVFELAACGAFQLCDMRSELPPLMEPGKEIETYSSLGELRDKIDYYLKNPEKASSIAAAGRERAIEEHTFENRMEEMFAVIMACEGESFAENIKAGGGRNVVKNMIAEAGADDPGLSRYLSQFDPEKELALSEVMERIHRGKGKLSRTEKLFLMVNQLLVQK